MGRAWITTQVIFIMSFKFSFMNLIRVDWVNSETSNET